MNTLASVLSACAGAIRVFSDGRLAATPRDAHRAPSIVAMGDITVLLNGDMSYDFKNIDLVRTDFTHREIFDLIVGTLKNDAVKVENDTLVYKNGQLQGSTQAVLSRQAAVVFIQYFAAVGMALDGPTVQAKLDNLQSIIDRRYWDSMSDATDEYKSMSDAKKYTDKDFKPSVALTATPHRRLRTGYKEIVNALRTITAKFVESSPEEPPDVTHVNVLDTYVHTVRVVLSQPVIVKFAALGDKELGNVLKKITADSGWYDAFNENSGNGTVKMITLLTQLLFVDMNVAWESAIKARLWDLLSTETAVNKLMNSGVTDDDQSTYASWLRVASYRRDDDPSPRAMYIQRYLDILEAIVSNYQDDKTHDRMVPVMQKMCAGIQTAVPYLQRATDFLLQLQQRTGLLSRLDEYLNAALSDPARGILTYVKLRYDNASGQWVHNDRFKFLHNEKNHSMRVFYTDTDDAIYKGGHDEPPVRIWPGDPAEFGLTEHSHENPPSFTQKDVERVQKTDNKLYNKQWAVGPFTDVFAPQLDNVSIAARLLGGGKPSPISDALTAEDASPVFVIGYGASGAGKTSTLIYYNKMQTNGILIDLCNTIGKDGLDIHMTAVEFFAIPESTEFEDSKSLKFVELLDKDGARVIRRESPVLVFKYQRGSYVLAQDTPYTNMHHSRVQIVLKQQLETYMALPGELKTTENQPFTIKDRVTKFPENALLGRVVVHMIDTDRYVKATTNNPNSSRSHVLVFLKFGSNNTRRQLIIGDFAGVENRFLCDDPKVLARFDGIRQDMPGNKRGPKFYDVFTTGLSKDELKGGGKGIDKDKCPPFWPLDPVSAWPDGWTHGLIDDTMIQGRNQIILHDMFATLIDKNRREVTDVISKATKYIADHVTYNLVQPTGEVTWKGDTDSMQSLLRTIGISLTADSVTFQVAVNQLSEMYRNYILMQNIMINILDLRTTTWHDSRQKDAYDKLKTTIPQLKENIKKRLGNLKSNLNMNLNMMELSTYLDQLQDIGLKVCDAYLEQTQLGQTLQQRERFVFNLVGKGDTVTSHSIESIKDKTMVTLPSSKDTVIKNTWVENVETAIRASVTVRQSNLKLIGNNWSPSDIDYAYMAKTIVCPSLFLRAFDKYEMSTAELILRNATVPIAHGTPADIKNKLQLLDSPDKLAINNLINGGVSLENQAWQQIVTRLSDDHVRNTPEFPAALPAVLVPVENTTVPFNDWSDSFARYLQSVKRVPIFALGLTDAVLQHCQYYWDTHDKLADACRKRTLEGNYINHSLRQIRLTIMALLLEKNRGRPSVVPPFIDSCLPQYCTDGCFTDAADHAPESRAEVQTLIKEIRDQLPEKFAMKDTRLALLCVVNASRSANEPLHTPYVDATQLKRAFYAGDHDAVSAALVTLYKDIQERVSRSPPAKLEYQQLLDELSPYLTFDASKAPHAKYRVEITSKYVTLLSSIDAWNGPSTIGTLEFTDALSKFARVTTMCKVDDINLPGNWTDHLSK